MSPDSHDQQIGLAALSYVARRQGARQKLRMSIIIHAERDGEMLNLQVRFVVPRCRQREQQDILFKAGNTALRLVVTAYAEPARWHRPSSPLWHARSFHRTFQLLNSDCIGAKSPTSPCSVQRPVLSSE